MEILIVEDEALNATRLQRMLQEINPDIRIPGVCESITETVDWIRSHPLPDLVLMDIRLADGLSFEIFEQVEIGCPVIFTTAYDEYAIRAFKVNSIDYLMKPIVQEDLSAALRKFESLRQQKVVSEPVKDILRYLEKKETIYRSRFLIPYKDGYRTVSAADVEFVVYDYGITHLALSDKTTVTVLQTMDELEEQLDPAQFFRANRQYIIHINSIEGIHNYFNGKLKVKLRTSPQSEVIISKEKARLFKNWLDR
ncbi:LytR/AlgR family response regulator transcription factor [Chitinophaga solisilvae]|uniref:Response regulator transcription factor n=1 Tax=Chitinophaga solisilvae TaxID=1233460 RepID=A0A433WL47_9BACT|nr:LytTR family DNA-binding domain-containing protein [Chitinophaga solisilvae]NSL87700.1 response regulator transcription factor [Chitinophaga solisilvae]